MRHDKTDRGLFQPGDGLLHQLDPRLKVVACLSLVILTFATTRWLSLLLIVLALAATARLALLSLSPLVRAIWLLRWLLVFTLFMHLLMTPGRTLWGTDWLSLDGLLLGLRVDLQIVLALFTAQLLTLSTSTADLARAFGWFIRPLRHFGFHPDELQGLLLHALYFLPVVRAEAGVAGATGETGRAERSNWEDWSARLEGFVLRLVERGDVMAHRLAAGKSVGERLTDLPPMLPLASREKLFILTFTLLALLCQLMG